MITGYYRVVFFAALMLFNSGFASAGERVDYTHKDLQLEGYWSASKCKTASSDPLVLIVHQWRGLGEYEKERADMLAKECYNAFAIDIYGKGVRPENNKAASKESSKYKNNPELARDRLQATLNYARKKINDDKRQAAIMGYCFGGTMALELARSGADINAAVSFHGGLSTKKPADSSAGTINASIQVHHGAEDPYVPEDEVKAFIDEMDAAEADWFLIKYADAVHSFTEKAAGNDPSKGVAYNEKADKRSWATTLVFLDQVFGSKQ